MIDGINRISDLSKTLLIVPYGKPIIGKKNYEMGEKILSENINRVGIGRHLISLQVPSYRFTYLHRKR